MKTTDLYRMILLPRPTMGIDQTFDFIELLTRDPREEIHIPCSKESVAIRIAAKVLQITPERTVRINKTDLAHYVVIEREQLRA